jgi:hypothetical protein
MARSRKPRDKAPAPAPGPDAPPADHGGGIEEPDFTEADLAAADRAWARIAAQDRGEIPRDDTPLYDHSMPGEPWTSEELDEFYSGMD